MQIEESDRTEESRYREYHMTERYHRLQEEKKEGGGGGGGKERGRGGGDGDGEEEEKEGERPEASAFKNTLLREHRNRSRFCYQRRLTGWAPSRLEGKGTAN